MKKMGKSTMQTIVGGKTIRCECGSKFSDMKFLFWTIMSADSQFRNHKATCWVYEDYAGYKSVMRYCAT